MLTMSETSGMPPLFLLRQTLIISDAVFETPFSFKSGLAYGMRGSCLRNPNTEPFVVHSLLGPKEPA